MGFHRNIDHEHFPKQGCYLSRHVKVCFHYDASKCLEGVIVRDDAEAPYETIILLSNGRYVRGGECQYSLL